MTDKKKPQDIDDTELDDVQGAGAGVSPFISRDETELTSIHGSDFNAAMGNDSRGSQFHGSDFNAVKGNRNANNGEGW